MLQNTLIITEVKLGQTKNGERSFINYLDPNTLKSANRIAKPVFASYLKAGDTVTGNIISAEVEPYVFTIGKDENKKEITAKTATIVKLYAETLDAAIVASGRKVPAVVVYAPVVTAEAEVMA